MSQEQILQGGRVVRELPGQNPEGIRFGRYILHRKVGIGGMAEVWLAEMVGPSGFGRIVALKRLHAQLSKDQEFIDSFISEARVGGSLDHPNIVRTIEFGQEGASWYLAMEYVQGVSLTTLLRAARKQQQLIPTAMSLEIMRQLFEGLTYAHSATDPRGRPLELVHRDLKPGNILLDRYGQVRVSDFGIARSTAAVRVTMAAGVLKGTLAYMSPEQASCQKLDARSDLYSAGSMFYELLTREPLHPHAQGLAGLHEVMRGEIGPRLALLVGQPTALVRIVTRLLQPRREDRYDNALEVLKELQALQSSQGRATEVLAQWVQQLQPASSGPLLPGGNHVPAVASSGPESMLDLSEALQTSMEPVSEMGRLELTLQRPESSSAPARITGRRVEPTGPAPSSAQEILGGQLSRGQIGATIPVFPVGKRIPDVNAPPLEPTVPVATGILQLDGFVYEGQEQQTGFVEMTRASRPFSGVPDRMDGIPGGSPQNPGAEAPAPGGLSPAPGGLSGAPSPSAWMQGGAGGMAAPSLVNPTPDPAALMAPTVLVGQIPQSLERYTVISAPSQGGAQSGEWSRTAHAGLSTPYGGMPYGGMPSAPTPWQPSVGLWIGVTLGAGALLGVLLAVFWVSRGPQAADPSLQEPPPLLQLVRAPGSAVQERAPGRVQAVPSVPTPDALADKRAEEPRGASDAAAVSTLGAPDTPAAVQDGPSSGEAGEARVPSVDPEREPTVSVKTVPVVAVPVAAPSVTTTEGAASKGAEPTRSASKSLGSARLTVNARPFAWVYVNGKKLPDPTPLWDQKVPAGTLKLRFVAEDGRTVERTVSLKSGESRRLDPVVFE